MPIVVTCTCGKRLAAKDEAAGKRVRCPACQQPILIPVPDVTGVVATPASAPGVIAVAAPTATSQPATTAAVQQPASPPNPSTPMAREPHASKPATEPSAVTEPQMVLSSSPVAAGADEPTAETEAAHEQRPKPRRFAVPSRLAMVRGTIAPMLRATGRLPWLPLLSAVSAVVWILGVVATIKPTLLLSPKTVVEPVRQETINGAAVSTQTAATRRFAQIGGRWVYQRQSEKRVVAGSGRPEAATAASLEFAPPGTFVTDPSARRTELPGFLYAYQGRTDGRSLLLAARSEINLAVWSVLLPTAILPAAWIARAALRRRRRRGAAGD